MARTKGRPRKTSKAAAKAIADKYVDDKGKSVDPNPQEIIALLPKDSTLPLTDDTMRAIMAHVSDGKSVDNIAQLPGMPDKATIYKRIDRDERWGEEYKKATIQRARSRAEQAERQMDAMLVDDDFKRATMYEARIRSLVRLAALNDPMRYSEKMMHLHHHQGEVSVKLEFDLGSKVVDGKISESKIEDISGD